MRPTECKWCGCRDIEREAPVMQSLIVSFACGTMSDTDAGGTRWLRDQRCAGPVGRLYKRIQRALQRLETATRFELVKDDYGAYMKGRDSWGNWLDVIQIEQAIEILKGETDEQAD